MDSNRPIVYAPVEIDPDNRFSGAPPVGAHVPTYLYNNFEYKVWVGNMRDLHIQLPDGSAQAVSIAPIIRQALRAAGFEAAEPK